MSGYIVTFKDTASPEEIKKFKEERFTGGELGHSYDGLISGFSAKIQPQTLQFFEQQKGLTGSVIANIEKDQTVTTQ
ncbi:hypothetical protein BDP27DRAFT_1446192 [Rhodocollybia butyracea]|uniref:Inhibitor I9 domain-containing protein n=1 Tax=Rhodocollybia butyracea TaxID=206335 RepID=A0A9P5Q079_9AGAR|nr:hypothetical protein BDP27DRAFT_1446192 [Rhodocollybia butyracea]